MSNITIFRNKTIKSQTLKKFNIISQKNNNINQKQKVFLATSLKRKKKNLIEKKMNNRYKNYDMIINGKNNNFNYLTPRYYLIGEGKYVNREFDINSFKSIDNNNEKSFIMNNNLIEYNSIISLLDKIIKKLNSYHILIKIKNYIKELISKNNNNMTLNYSFSKDSLLINNKSPLSAHRLINNKNESKEKKNKEELNKSYKYNNLIKNNLEIENNYLTRKIKKLCQKINELEEKYKIEQLKYLFFIIEQEKKIAELEKNFDNKQIPLDERIIEKMKELKCYPNYYKPELDEEISIIRKNAPLSSKIRTIIPNKNNNSFLKSRNKKINFNNNKYSFDQEIDLIPKKNQSQVINVKEKENENKKEESTTIKSKVKNINIEDINDMSEIKKQITKNFQKSVNQFFNEKNFFISHPKLKYVKDSQEKNHFQRIKAKEQSNGISNLLSNIKLGSKFQKSAVNDFCYFINNSMVNVEKLKGYHNYMNIENKFEENLKLKRKSSM